MNFDQMLKDISVRGNGDIRYIGTGTMYSVEDLVSLLHHIPHSRDFCDLNNWEVTLKTPFNIDEYLAYHLKGYKKAITQEDGGTRYISFSIDFEDYGNFPTPLFQVVRRDGIINLPSNGQDRTVCSLLLLVKRDGEALYNDHIRVQDRNNPSSCQYVPAGGFDAFASFHVVQN